MRLINPIIYIISISLLSGCTWEQSAEDFFFDEMKRMAKETEDDYPYQLLKQEESVVHDNDAITIFTENNQEGEQIFIAYFEKTDGRWNWEYTRGAMWDDGVNWSMMGDDPYIFSGDISDNTIESVYVDGAPAEIIEVEGNKRFWYATVSDETENIKYVYNNGNEKIVEFWEGPSE